MTVQELKPAEKATQIKEYNEFEAQLAEFKQRYAGNVYDFDDPEQAKQANVDIRAIGSAKSKLDKVHDTIKAPYMVHVGLIDSERKRIKDQLQEVQDKILTQKKEHERRIQEEQDRLQAMVEGIEAHAVFYVPPSSSEVEMRLKSLATIEINEDFGIRQADAEVAVDQVTTQLNDLLISVKQREVEQAELEEFRRKEAERQQQEREEKIRREAEENARKQAEAAAAREKALQEQELEQARRRAEEAEAAKERAVEEAARQERERIEAEQRALDELADKQRKEEEAAKKKAAHRKRIHQAAIMSLVGVSGMDEPTATAVIEAIKDGKVAHVRIEY